MKWEYNKLKYISHIEMGQSPDSRDCTLNPNQGLPFYQGTAEFGNLFPTPKQYCLVAPKIAPDNAILFSVRAPVGDMNINRGQSGIGRGLCAIIPKDFVDKQYVWWTLIAVRKDLSLVSTGSTYEAVSLFEVANLKIPLPSTNIQTKIAAYLDKETKRIDALIEAKKSVLVLLSEKRRALISHAVTKGLNPDVKMRDSGIPWLGEIPEHWGVERIIWSFQERDERNEPDLPLLQVSIHNGVQIRKLSDDQINQRADDYNIYKVARQNDISFNKMRMWQGAVGTVPRDGLVSPDYVVAEPITDMVSKYYGILFKTSRFSDESGSRSHGIVWDRLRLYWEEFKDISIPIPPVEEQKAMVDYLNSKLVKMGELEEANEDTISLLQERRSALITAAVTGELEEAYL